MEYEHDVHFEVFILHCQEAIKVAEKGGKYSTFHVSLKMQKVKEIIGLLCYFLLHSPQLLLEFEIFLHAHFNL